MASAFYVSVLYCSCLSAEKLKKTSMEILFLKQKLWGTERNVY